MIQKWEYKSLATKDLEAPEVAEFGQEGWELVAMLLTQVATSPIHTPQVAIVLMFKRPILNVTLD